MNTPPLNRHISPEQKFKGEQNIKQSSPINISSQEVINPLLIKEEVTHLLDPSIPLTSSLKIEIETFAQIHSSSRLNHTNFEGIAFKSIYAYWHNMLLECGKLKDFDTEELKLLEKPIKNGLDTFTSLNKTPVISEEVTGQIFRGLKENGSFYLPMSWSDHIRGGGGHAVVVKFKLEDGEVKIYVLNRGEGSQMHPIALVDGSKVKYDPRSITTIIPADEFFSKTGGLLINKMLQLPQGLQNENLQPYSCEDLYALLQIFSYKTINNENNPAMATTSQRSDNCPEASFQAMLKDTIYNSKSMSPKGLKKLTFKLKQMSLINGFKQFRTAAKSDPNLRYLLQDAARQYATRALKEKKSLTPTEQVRAAEIASYILQELQEAPPAPRALPLQASLPAQAVAQKPVPILVSIGQFDMHEEYLQNKTEMTHLEIPKIMAPNSILQSINTNIGIIEQRLENNVSPLETFIEIYNFVSALPHGLTAEEKGSNKLFWDNIKPKEAATYLNAFYRLSMLTVECASRVKSQEKGSKLPLLDKGKLLEISYRTYDIAAQIAPKIKELKLNEFGCALEIPDRKFFDNPQTIQVVDLIEKNFKTRNGAKKTAFHAVMNAKSSHAKYIKNLYGSVLFNFLSLKEVKLFDHNDRDAVVYLRLLNPANKMLPEAYFQLEALASLTKGLKRKNFDIEKNKGKKNIYKLGFYHLSDNDSYEIIFPFNMSFARSEGKHVKKWLAENEVFSLAKYIKEKKSPLPLEVRQEIAIISVEKDDAPVHILEWAKEHLEHLENPNIQKEIEKNLFRYKTLPKNISEQPVGMVTLTQNFLQAALTKYAGQPNKADTTLWLLQLSDNLEGYLKEYLPEKNNTFQWIDVDSIYSDLFTRDLSPKNRLQLAKQQLKHFNFFPPQTDKAYLNFIQYIFLKEMFSTKQEGHALVDYEAQKSILQHLPSCIAWLKQKAPAQVANRILEVTFPDIKAENIGGAWQFKDENELTNGTFSLLLREGKIFRDKQNIVPLADQVMNQSLYKQIFGDKHFPGVIEEGYLYDATTKNWRLQIGVGEGGALQLKHIERKVGENWYRYIEEADKLLVDIPEHFKEKKSGYFAAKYTHWISCDSNPAELLIKEAGSDKFLYKYTQKQGLLALDELGHETGNRIVNLNSPNEGMATFWATTFGDLETIGETLIEVKPEGKNDVVEKITFPRLSLMFERQGSVLMCSNFPGFFLQNPQDSFFKSFRGYMVLQNAQGIKKVIIPSHPLRAQPREENNIAIETKVSVNPAALIDTKSPYFSYNVTSDGLHATSPQGALYASLLYRNEKQYAKALEYLKDSASPHKNTALDWEIAKQILIQKDLSPEGTSYDLHLKLRMHEQESKFSDFKNEKKKAEEPNKQKTEMLKAFNKFISMQFAEYLNFIGNIEADIYQVPENLRLTESEENLLKKLNHSHLYPDHNLLPWKAFNPLTDDAKGSTISILSNFLGEVQNLTVELAHKELALKAAKNMAIDLVIQKGDQTEEEKEKELESTSKEFASLLKSIPSEKIAAQLLENELRNVEVNTLEYRPGNLRNENLSSADDILSYYIQHCDKILEHLCSKDPLERRLGLLDVLYTIRNSQDKSIYKHCSSFTDTLLYAGKYPDAFRQLIVHNDPEKTLLQIFTKIIEDSRKEDFPKNIEIALASQPPVEKSMFEAAEKISSKHTKELAAITIPFTIKNVSTYTAPLSDLYDKNFLPQQPQVGVSTQVEAIPLFDKKDFTNALPLAVQQMTSYNENKKKVEPAPMHSLNASDPTELLSNLKKISLEEEAQNARLKQEILEKANINPIEGQEVTALQLQSGIHQRMLLQAKQKTELALADVLAAFLVGDSARLCHANPFLTEKDCKEIFEQLAVLYLQESRRLQAEEAIAVLELRENIPEWQQQVGDILARNRHYDIEKYPQLVVYEAMTGRMLRKDQVEAIEWTLEGGGEGDTTHSMRLLQAFAGFGKTKVFSTIIAMMLAQKGMLPVVVNTSTLYDFGKSDLAESLKQAFSQNIEVIELEIGDQLDKKYLKTLKDNLQRWQSAKKCLLIKPESWHVLNIHYKDAYLRKDPAFPIIKDIMKYFNDKGFVIPDEAHLICSPLQEAIKAVGMGERLSAVDKDLFLFNYRVLNGQDAESAAIKNVVNLEKNQQSYIGPEELKKVQAELVNASLRYELFSEVDKNNLAAFLQAPLTAEKPKWLETLHQEQPLLAELIALQQGFISSILPHVLSRKGGVEYGDSIHEGDLTAAPRHDKQSSPAKFADEYIAMALSIQHIYQNGMTNEGVREMLRALQKSHHNERRTNKTTMTHAEQLLQKFCSTHSAVDAKLNLNLDIMPMASTLDDSILEAFAEKMKGNAQAFHYYLDEIVLSQVVIFRQKLVSTPAEFLSGFAGGLCLTATPGTLETFPVALTRDITANKLDRSSEAETIAAMLSERNNKIAIVTSYDDPAAFFKELYTKEPTSFDRLFYLIDRAGGFRGVGSNKVATTFLDVAKELQIMTGLTGSIAVDIDTEGKRRAIFNSADENSISVSLEGSELATAMKKRGLDPAMLSKAFHFYSIMETTGTDWKLPKPSQGIFTVGEGQTATDSIQAVKRDRAFCNEKHSILWVAAQKMLGIMGKDADSLTPKELVLWMIDNEAKQQEKKLWMRFQQGLDNIIANHIKNKVQEQQEPFKSDNYARYCSILKKIDNMTPYERYQEVFPIENVQDKEKFLQQKVLQVYHQLGFEDETLEEFSEQERKDLALLISQTAELLPKISANQHSLDAEAVQESIQIEEQDQMQISLQEQQSLLDENVRFLEESYDHNDYSLKNPNFIDKDRFSAHACESPACGLKYMKPDTLTKDRGHNQHQYLGHFLGIEDPASLPLILGDCFVLTPDSFNILDPKKPNSHTTVYLRPARAILAQIDDTSSPPTYQFVALSASGYKAYKNQIEKNANEGTQKKYLILGCEGNLLVQNERNTLSKEALEALQNSSQLQDICAIVALTKGKIYEPKRLANIFKNMTPEAFGTMVDKLSSSFITFGTTLDMVGINEIKKINWSKENKLPSPLRHVKVTHNSLKGLSFPLAPRPGEKAELPTRVVATPITLTASTATSNNNSSHSHNSNSPSWFAAPLASHAEDLSTQNPSQKQVTDVRRVTLVSLKSEKEKKAHKTGIFSLSSLMPQQHHYDPKELDKEKQ